MPDSFQIRVCQNPDCGLRFPVLLDEQGGGRCPICLGETRAVMERPVRHETPRRAIPPRAGARLEAVLDNVRSAWNVGSIFRSAEGFGFEHLYLCGITPTPEHDGVRKTALGAGRSVAWSAHRNGAKLIEELKRAGCAIWALESTPQSVPIESASSQENSGARVLIVGNEKTGVDPGILEMADHVVHLDMCGEKESFNVAVAFAVAAHVLRNKTRGL